MHQLSEFYHFYLAPQGDHWWKGNMWGNIVANVFWGALALLITRAIIKLMKAHHKEHMAKLNLMHKDIKGE